MQLINLTRHNILFKDEANLASLGTVRRSEHKKHIGEINGIPDYIKFLGGVQYLPEPQSDTIYIVPSFVALKMQYREDLRVPGWVNPKGVTEYLSRLLEE
jgi:hypothetical protein